MVCVIVKATKFYASLESLVIVLGFNDQMLMNVSISLEMWMQCQGSKIALVRSYLRVPQAAGQVKILIFLVKIKFFLIHAINFCDAGQVSILRYFKT